MFDIIKKLCYFDSYALQLVFSSSEAVTTNQTQKSLCI